METEYKIKIGTDDKGISVTLLSHEDKKSRIINNKATTYEDFEVIEACRGLAELLNSEEIEIKIKPKYN